MSRTTLATILTDEIDSAVPRNSDVMMRLSGSGRSDSGMMSEQHAAGERQHDAGDRGADGGTAHAAHQREFSLHPGEQQKQ